MHLSKLEIFGFKSFANKTTIHFTKGITGIVGPNGCGKTNIVDAIRWVLGEQKTTTLRSDKMENVIFNGTRNKKPMGMSEVSLTLVNDLGLLPTEYSEVTITRRIFRSGESEYLLNKNICRLKDITNLFMDTGMGTNAYSVIELKMVETILSNKADERRKMFEEAAGVNKYKLRRRLALNKLEDVKADLTRVNDIISEVEKTVRSLERQAKRADQYNQIQSVLRQKEIELAEREMALYKIKNEQLTQNIYNYNSQKNVIDDEIKKIENELLELRIKISEVESKLNEKRNEITSNTELLHSLQKDTSVAEEKQKALEKNLERLYEEIIELNAQISENEKLIQENNLLLQKLNISQKENEELLTKTNEEINIKRKVHNEKKQTLRNLNEKLLNHTKVISEKENQLSTVQSELTNTYALIEKLNEKIRTTTGNIAKTVGYIEELTDEKNQIGKKLAETEELYNQKQKEKEKLERELNLLKENEIEQKTIIASLKEKINFLQSLITNLEGISKGSKTLLENDNWTTKEKNIFADVGTANEKYRFALNAALKSVLNNLLIENFEELKKAVDYLKQNELGKASFYLLENASNGKKSFLKLINGYANRKKIKKLSNEKSFLGWAFEFVEAEDKWKPYFKKILNSTVITDSLENAIELHKKYDNINFVTLQGDYVSCNGIIEAGSLPKLDETLFGRKQLLENLKNEYPKLETELNSLSQKIEEIEATLSKIDLKKLNEKIKILSNDITNIEKQVSQFEFEKKKYDEDIENTMKQIQELVTRSTSFSNEKEVLIREMEELSHYKDNLISNINTAEEELKTAEDNFNLAISKLNQQELEQERIKGQIQNAFNSIQRSEENKILINNGINKREKEIIKSKSEIEGINTELSKIKNKLEEVNNKRKNLFEEEKEIENQLKVLKEKSTKLETELNNYRNKRQNVSDNVHSLQIKQNEIELRITNLIEHIKENYSLTIEEKTFDDLDQFNFEERAEEVNRLKDKLKSIGPVNLLAYSEYEEEKERLDFLLKQRNDLIESEKDLINTINEINETAQKLFLDTFEQIRNNFTKIFQTLFNPGDEADLKLEEGVDPLEAKIEIIGKPKGKRPTTIELLSGGEKTLTAIALLFSIYLVKPSPFCILDEVDAPLDDANIDRFTKLLAEFSKRTQFIIVTHNKRTMEAAETMYGVTMQEEGISKLAAVQFNEINVN
ncbi:chromosome segregation protein SMC [Melioribacteraceae bacterium 4301-Me]|uniref:chromosome segregation protein SMC n=1 Tax=Pyranulibacter aquaticus TaxID=3163344 RepID=UPI0035974D78